MVLISFGEFFLKKLLNNARITQDEDIISSLCIKHLVCSIYISLLLLPWIKDVWEEPLTGLKRKFIFIDVTGGLSVNFPATDLSSSSLFKLTVTVEPEDYRS